MPESRRRKKKQSVVMPQSTPKSTKNLVSPRWVGPSIVTLFAVGVLWLVLYYITNGGIVGQDDLGRWNVLIGFGFIIGGFGMATQWK